MLACKLTQCKHLSQSSPKAIINDVLSYIALSNLELGQIHYVMEREH